jgi:deoxyribodipyrimidine photo-lyase
MDNNLNTIIWFRNDLRITDHEPLFIAEKLWHSVIPVYIIDPREYEILPLGFPKTGEFRKQFIAESVIDLQKSLQSIGLELQIYKGKPEVIIPELAAKHQTKTVFAHAENAWNEQQIENKLQHQLANQDVKLQLFHGATLLHPQDLPFEINDLPDIFTNFRKLVEKKFLVRKTFKKPKEIKGIKSERISEDSIHQLFPTTQPNIDSRAALLFVGGESEAHKRVETYFWKHDLLQVYKETRNGLIGADYSSKFSPWLSVGAISPRTIYEEIKKYETERVSNQSTYWLVFELLWRDYFQFVMMKFGRKLFLKYGIRGIKTDKKGSNYLRAFEKWVNGSSGNSFIDANMLELKLTGFMSNRGRQNVASILVNDLQLDWRMGAQYFESQLIDYDVCSNWGNWAYIAGVGNNPRENRYFNIQKQAEMYDAQGLYQKLWLEV